MKLYLKFDINSICKKVLQEQLDSLHLNYTVLGFGEVELNNSPSKETIKKLNQSLNDYGISVVESHKSVLVQKIKDAIVEMVYSDEKLSTSKTSAYLADKIGQSYGYISNLFSDVTYTSIANYIILQKIERAKQLILTNELTITEIAWKLNYSSVAHFSNQFKGATGLTPSAFQRIIDKRKNNIRNI
ncbi:AraC family transcriptional regulator [uncultured Cytophaga sp.]|uniref:helix-turn-helix domain-containing protein n=1 Tax=uncultured Cytophaga sp. TaxID=160238 RepID=UPI0026157DE3|nr:AraC family transcriptional regulator [uncultured Cytophaga sp.]